MFDGSGQKRGIIVMNYLAQRILDRIHMLGADDTDVWLLNSDGYWLLGSKPEDTFAFMYPDRKDRSFATAYPEIWRLMQARPQSGSLDDDHGRFAYVRADSVSGQTEGETLPYWFVMIHSPAAVLATQTGGLRSRFSTAAAVLVLLVAAVSVGLARYQIYRRDAQQQVSQSEARFRGLLESAPDAILITDDRGRITLVNAQTELLFGYRRDELIGKPIEILVPERYRGAHVGHRSAYLGNARTRPMGAGLELYGLRKDGSEFPVAIGLSPTSIEDAPTVFCDVRDVTEQRASQAKIQELNQRLQLDNAELAAVIKELEAFSYSVSHDLRAPLRAIDGFSQALMEDAGPLLNSEHLSYLNRVRQAAQRMGLLIDDLIKLARVTRTDIKIGDVDLTAMAQKIVTELQDGAPERQAEFIIAPGLHTNGDSRLVQVALDNLLGNSWKFTAPRSPARIEFGSTDVDGKPTFFVQDNGVGFDMTYAGKMFGAFQRFHDAREFAGTGIGLATVQRIIHKHGGRIWAESQPGVGATFYFTL
ncbi:MAG: PAS domain S-box protein [Dongiaceae bacterium]